VRIVVEAERMLLRRFTQADAGPLAALYGDTRVIRFITPQPPSLAEVEATILPEYLHEYRELTGGLGVLQLAQGDLLLEVRSSLDTSSSAVTIVSGTGAGPGSARTG
jgi:hypothetical protein